MAKVNGHKTDTKIVIDQKQLFRKEEMYVSEDENEVEELNKRAAECLKRYRNYAYSGSNSKEDTSQTFDNQDG